MGWRRARGGFLPGPNCCQLVTAAYNPSTIFMTMLMRITRMVMMIVSTNNHKKIILMTKQHR